MLSYFSEHGLAAEGSCRRRGFAAVGTDYAMADKQHARREIRLASRPSA